jgi:microcystin-dependent protein
VEYPELAAYLAPHFTFNSVVYLPDMRGRYPVGGDDFGNEPIGTPVGDNDRTLTVAQMPAHAHTQAAHSHSVDAKERSTVGVTGRVMLASSAGTDASAGTTSVTPVINSQGGGQSFDNRPNSLTITWVIRAAP